MRLPRPVRTPLLLLLLIGMSLAAGERLEALRLRLIVPLAVSSGKFHPSAEAPPPARSPQVEDAIRQAYRREAERFGERASARVRVFDWDVRRGRLIIGAGRRHGVERGALVWLPEGVLGVVDAATPHLARVALVSARRTRLAVRVRVEKDLPGDLEGLAGALDGTGEGARLGRMALSEFMRPGDRVEILGRGPLDGLPVGTVERAGPLAEVALSAAATDAVTVLVEGVDRPPGLIELFELIPARVRFQPGAPRDEVLLEGARTSEVAVGSAVIAGGQYLGRVVRRSGRWLRAETMAGHRGPQRFTFLIGSRRPWTVELEARSPGQFIAAEGARLVEQAVVLTAGGDELVPAGVFVGRATLRDSATPRNFELDGPPRRWPDAVRVAHFRHARERVRLGGQRR